MCSRSRRGTRPVQNNADPSALGGGGSRIDKEISLYADDTAVCAASRYSLNGMVFDVLHQLGWLLHMARLYFCPRCYGNGIMPVYVFEQIRGWKAISHNDRSLKVLLNFVKSMDIPKINQCFYKPEHSFIKEDSIHAGFFRDIQRKTRQSRGHILNFIKKFVLIANDEENGCPKWSNSVFGSF